jgi:hypothetical protein
MTEIRSRSDGQSGAADSGGINPFVPRDSAIYLGNGRKNYEAHIFGMTLGYPTASSSGSSRL